MSKPPLTLFTPGYPAWEALPDDLRQKQSTAALCYNAMFVGILFFASMAGMIFVFVAMSIPLLGWTLFGLDGVVTLLMFLLVVPWVMRGIARQLKFLCPICGASLFEPSSRGNPSPLIEQGTCPSCGRSLLSCDPAIWAE